MLFLYLNTKEFSHLKHLVDLNLTVIGSEQDPKMSSKKCLGSLNDDEFAILMHKFTNELAQTMINPKAN